MQNIFDSHAHYDSEEFAPDREALLALLPAQGVRYVMNIGTDLASSREAIATAERFDSIYCAVGVHPHEAADAPSDLEEQLRALSRHPKVRALGEMGLDYHYDFAPRQQQLEVFERQLLLADELELPVVIHDREAHADTLALLKKHRPRGVMHCCSGSAEMVAELLGLGLYIGFTGAVTFKNARRPLKAMLAVPEDRLLIETDCPYMAPVPCRGQRCDSSMLRYTAEAMAAARGIPLQHLLDSTCENACRVFGIE